MGNRQRLFLWGTVFFGSGMRSADYMQKKQYAVPMGMMRITSTISGSSKRKKNVAGAIRTSEKHFLIMNAVKTAFIDKMQLRMLIHI